MRSIGGGLLAVEFVPTEPTMDKDLREVQRDHTNAAMSQDPQDAVRHDPHDQVIDDQILDEHILDDSTSGADDPWADNTFEQLREEDDEVMEILQPDNGDTAGNKSGGPDVGQDGEAPDQEEAEVNNTSYQTRSKGVPKNIRPSRGGATRKHVRTSSTPKGTRPRNNWEDFAESEGDGSESVDGSGRGTQAIRTSLRLSEEKRRRRERERQQHMRRLMEWTIRETPEEGGGTQRGGPQAGPSMEGMQVQPAMVGGTSGPTEQGGRPIGSLPVMQQQQHEQVVQAANRPTQSRDIGSRPAPTSGGSSTLTGATGEGRDEEGDVALLPPTSETITCITDAMNAKCTGGGDEFFEPAEEGVEEVEDEFYELDAGLDETLGDRNITRVVNVADLVGDQIDLGNGGTMKIAEIIPFIVLKYDPMTDKNWTIPDPDLYWILINRVTNAAMERDNTAGDAYRWATLWGKVGLIGLASRDLTALNGYRKLVEEQVSGNTRFTLYPKDALEKRANLSVLLRENYIGFNIKWLAKAIMMRSRMKGGLRVTHIKTYQDSDVTRNGVSKMGWRLVLLQGCHGSSRTWRATTMNTAFQWPRDT